MRQGKHKGGSVSCQESACHKIRFAKLGEQYRGQDTLASFKAAFFTRAIFKIYKNRQKIPNERETTVLVGDITKVVCVR